MSVYLQNLAVWDWLALAVLLLIVEVFGTAGYFCGFGSAAAMVGVLLLVFPELSWVWQFTAFALLSLATAWLWWQRLRTQPSVAPRLNQRGSELLGVNISCMKRSVLGAVKLKQVTVTG